MSPMTILQEPPSEANQKWLEENFTDFSLSSFLGHLDSAMSDGNSKQRLSSPIREVGLSIQCSDIPRLEKKF